MRTFIKTLLLPVTLPIGIYLYILSKITHLLVFVFDDTYDPYVAREVFKFEEGLLPKYMQKGNKDEIIQNKK